jgi:hypothetical protein
VSDDDANPDQVVRDSIRLTIVCQHCGEVAMMDLRPELARRHATHVLSAADNLDRVEDIEVRGEG